METHLADKTSPPFLQAWLSQRRCRVLAGPLKCSDNKKKKAASLLLRQKINQGQVTGSQNCPSVHPRGQIFTSQTLCRRQPSPDGLFGYSHQRFGDGKGSTIWAQTCHTPYPSSLEASPILCCLPAWMEPGSLPVALSLSTFFSPH